MYKNIWGIINLDQQICMDYTVIYLFCYYLDKDCFGQLKVNVNGI